MTVEEQLPQALPYLPPSQPPKPMVIESRIVERPMPSVEHRRRHSRNIARTWTILVLGLLTGIAAIVWEMLF